MAQKDMHVSCIVGLYPDKKPIWRNVGRLVTAKTSGKQVLLLDRTFNPAGCYQDESTTATSVVLHFFDIDTQPSKEKPALRPLRDRYADQFEDDIPF